MQPAPLANLTPSDVNVQSTVDQSTAEYVERESIQSLLDGVALRNDQEVTALISAICGRMCQSRGDISWIYRVSELTGDTMSLPMFFDLLSDDDSLNSADFISFLRATQDTNDADNARGQYILVNPPLKMLYTSLLAALALLKTEEWLEVQCRHLQQEVECLQTYESELEQEKAQVFQFRKYKLEEYREYCEPCSYTANELLYSLCQGDLVCVANVVEEGRMILDIGPGWSES